MCTDGEVFVVEFLVIVYSDEVIRPELRWRHFAAVTVEELDWHVIAVFSEERNGLLTCLDALLEMPDGCALAYEVALPQLTDLVMAFVLLVLDQLLELLI